MTTTPALRVLSLGAGVQSTTLMLLAAEGRIPRFDAALFADVGWEPERVYAHLERLVREVAQPAGIPVIQVQATTGTKGRVSGNLRADSLNPGAWVRMPVFVADRTGARAAMVRRQCTEEYKVKPIKAAVRELLGYPSPRPVPRGVFAEQAIGISRDEFTRAKDANVQYLRNTFPLLDLAGPGGIEGWSRNDCTRYLTARGWGTTPKSSCIGCPFHGNAAWRQMRDHHPDEWADAVAFDHQLRTTELRGIKATPYLHRSLLPLDQAPIDKVTYGEHAQRQGDLFDALGDQDEQDTPGCSPWSCHGESDEPEGQAA